MSPAQPEVRKYRQQCAALPNERKEATRSAAQPDVRKYGQQCAALPNERKYRQPNVPPVVVLDAITISIRLCDGFVNLR